MHRNFKGRHCVSTLVALFVGVSFFGCPPAMMDEITSNGNENSMDNGDSGSDDSNQNDNGDELGQSEAEPCDANLTGVGTNPGQGDEGMISMTLDYDGPDGSFVIVNPTLPPPFGTSLEITPSSITMVNFPCGEQIGLGEVTFVDADGNRSSAGEISFERGIDVACGQSTTVLFTQPCALRIQIE